MLIQRVLMWIGALALVIFVFVVHQSVSTLKTTVQGHTAALNMPVIARVRCGVLLRTCCSCLRSVQSILTVGR
jgi:hypothetical protein